jgi:hypothetical protein
MTENFENIFKHGTRNKQKLFYFLTLDCGEHSNAGHRSAKGENPKFIDGKC